MSPNPLPSWEGQARLFFFEQDEMLIFVLLNLDIRYCCPWRRFLDILLPNGKIIGL